MVKRTADPATTVYRRAILTIAAATGATTLSATMWFPFLPLFMLEVGAKDEADALFWVAVGLTAQGVARLLGGPLWGLLSDRVGRKKMFVRALYSGALAMFVLSAIRAPWQVAVALGLVGLLAGFVPAAVALTSVSVPEARVKTSLSMVAGSQYLGSAIGPAIGAATAIGFGHRGSIFASAVLVLLVATAVVFLVPGDIVRRTERDQAGNDVPHEPFRLTLQLALAIFLYFSLFALNMFLTVATPMALKEIAGSDVTALTGATFALGGIASALAILLLERRFFSTQRLRPMLTVASVLSGAALLLLALSNSVWLYIFAFTLSSLLNASMVPGTNALIAFNVSRTRRGTAFGLASGAQALAFMVGPMGAALFAATSLKAGFAVVSALLLGLAVLIGFAVREPTVK